MFDLGTKRSKKQLRFRRPEFQERLARARKFHRRPEPLPTRWGDAMLAKIGLQSRVTRILATLILLVIAYFLMLSRFLLIKQVILESGGPPAEQLSQVVQALSGDRVYLVPRNHILILTRNSLLRALQREFPQIREITEFRRIFPDKVQIVLEERKPSYIWQTGADYYLVDQEGVLFQKLYNYEPNAFSGILIVDRTGEAVRIGENLNISKVLNFVEQLKKQWPLFIPQGNFVNLAVPGRSSPDILVKVNIGFVVYFDLERSIRAQLTNLNLVLTKEIKPETYNGLSYIDLRLPNIAYYCYQDAPCALENATSTKKL